MSEAQEPLRRLKNTVMGASHRLTVIARAGDHGAPAEQNRAAAAELEAIARDLADAAQRLDRWLVRFGRDR